MPNLRQAAQQALEALENAVRYHGIVLMSDPPQAAWKYYRVEDNAKQAITALREALAQPVQPEAKVQNTEDAANEAAAKALYETWHSQPEYKPWQDGGNSHKQDEARELVRLAAHKLKPPLPEQEPVACRFCHSKKGCWAWQCYHCGEIDDVQKPAPQPVQEPMRVYVENFAAMSGWVKDSGEGAFNYIQRISYAQGVEDAIAHARPEQEPVAWMSSDRAWMWSDYSKAIAAVANIPTLTLIPLYAAPPQREWVGLTEDEIKGTWAQLWYDLTHGKLSTPDNEVRNNVVMFGQALEAKLKEKNNG